MKSLYRRVEKSHVIILLLFLLAFLSLAFKPLSRINWLLEALPVILLVLILVLTYMKFKFSNFVYISVLIQSIIILVGAKYITGIKPSLSYYSYLSYFTTGFALVLIVKEFVLRKKYLKRTDINYYIMISIAVASIQLYKTISFIIASIIKTPGYDNISYNQFQASIRWELLLSLIGAIVAVTVFGKIHDKEIE